MMLTHCGRVRGASGTPGGLGTFPVGSARVVARGYRFTRLTVTSGLRQLRGRQFRGPSGGSADCYPAGG